MDKKLLGYTNWGLILCTVLLFSIGLINLYSASAIRGEDGLLVAPYFYRQLGWFGGGFVAMACITLFDYRRLRGNAWVLFILSLILLVMVLLAGTTINGAKRWLSIGSFTVQPSELVKITTLIMGAAVLSRWKSYIGWTQLLYVLFIACIPCVFIFMQPDLGTALNVLLLIGGMILFQGIRASVFKVCCIVGPLLLPVGWFFITDYQRQRILTFLDPSQDLQGAGYHIHQSQIAIGSGRLWGKGFLEGTQSKLRFLPEKHTDFAVAVFSEEWGFMGCVVLLILFRCFLLCIVSTAVEAKDRFGSLLCAGVFFYFFWQIFINIGMVVGIFPVVGIPLPFISYGGTATVVNCILLGLVLNVSMRRFMFKAPQ